MIFTSVVIVAILAFLASAFRVLREYERAVVFLLGRFQSVKGPGLIIIVPLLQQIVRVDLRTIVMDVPTQDLITRDNVSVKVNAVLYFRVLDPDHAVLNVENYMEAIGQLAQTTLRSVLGQHELDELLSERERLNNNIQSILDQQTRPMGHQGRKRRNQARGHRRKHDPRHRQASRGGTRTESQDHPRGRRVRSILKVGRSRHPTRQRTRLDATPLPPNPHRNRRREVLHHRLPPARERDGVDEPAGRRRTRKRR